MRGVMIAVVVLVLASSAGQAALNSPHLDPVVADLEAKQQAGNLEKKEDRTATKSLKQVGKGSDSLAGDLKILKKLLAKLEKVFADDTELLQKLTQALSAYVAEVEAELMSLKAAAQALPESKAKAKALKSIAKSEELLNAARPAPAGKADPNSLKAKGKALLKSEKKLKKPRKILAKPPGNGGGCPGSALKPDEFAQGQLDSSPFQAQNLAVNVEKEGEVVTSVDIILYDCTEGARRSVWVSIPEAIRTVVYPVDIFQQGPIPNATVGWRDGADSGLVFFKTVFPGMVTVTDINSTTGLVTMDVSIPPDVDTERVEFPGLKVRVQLDGI
ncbi:MAG: hypothetical protein ACYS99_07650, partial [Planctomycetota bacterium]